MIKSKAWDWKVALAPHWEEPAYQVYPLINRWRNLGFKKLLDLGCGVGRHSILFAKNGFEVEAFDLSESGIEKLNETIKKDRLSIKTQIGDMLSLPYRDHSFDCLLACNVVYHTDDEGIKKVVNEIKKVLKPGGEVLINFLSKNSSAFTNPEYEHLSENVVMKKTGNEAGIPHLYLDKEQVLEIMKGFQIEALHYLEEYYPKYTGAHYFVLAKW